MLKKIINSNLFFTLLIGAFIISLAFATQMRGGRDLKPFLFGATQMLEKKSIYDNPNDPTRPMFRYAPAFAIMQVPFLLKSKMVEPYVFENMGPSIFAWFVFVVLALFGSIKILLKLLPGPSKAINIYNFKIGFLMAMPLIGYELSNCQSKLVALFFMLMAIYLFEHNRPFWCSIFFSLALTIYIPLIFFLFYFILIKRKPSFIFHFIAGALAIFLLIPFLVFGPQYYISSFKEWFTLVLKPFFVTSSYASYIDLRTSSQSMPSAIGRIFSSGFTGNFKYVIPPEAIHMLIRVFSAFMVLLSCFAVWKNPNPKLKGLYYSIFLILSLITPNYSIFYSWAWVFVFYFAVFNYLSYPGVSLREKKILRNLVIILFISTISIAVYILNRLSFLFWGTFIFWAGITAISLANKYKPDAAKVSHSQKA